MLHTTVSKEIWMCAGGLNPRILSCPVSYKIENIVRSIWDPFDWPFCTDFNEKHFNKNLRKRKSISVKSANLEQLRRSEYITKRTVWDSFIGAFVLFPMIGKS